MASKHIEAQRMTENTCVALDCYYLKRLFLKLKDRGFLKESKKILLYGRQVEEDLLKSDNLMDKIHYYREQKGKVKKQKVIHKVLYIDITNKSLEEMIQKYQLNDKQLEQLTELQKDKYRDLWANVLYGNSSESNDIVIVALSQVVNVGGQPYWSWYGFENRVEWCACFVSWCANQCGYIENGIIAKFASCQNEGIAWFKTCDLWQERGYIPKARRHYIL